MSISPPEVVNIVDDDVADGFGVVGECELEECLVVAEDGDLGGGAGGETETFAGGGTQPGVEPLAGGAVWEGTAMLAQGGHDEPMVIVEAVPTYTLRLRTKVSG